MPHNKNHPTSCRSGSYRRQGTLGPRPALKWWHWNGKADGPQCTPRGRGHHLPRCTLVQLGRPPCNQQATQATNPRRNENCTVSREDSLVTSRFDDFLLVAPVREVAPGTSQASHTVKRYCRVTNVCRKFKR